MNFVNLEDIIRSEFKPFVRTSLLAAIKSAYQLTLKHYKEYDFLNWSVGHNVFKEIRGIITQYSIMKFIELNNLGITYRISPNAIDSCEHIEIISGKCIMTISQVEHKGALPRKAIYRNELSVTNQLSIDFFNDGINDLNKPNQYYLLLTHGSYKDDSTAPDFVYMGFPKPGARKWEGEPFNLLTEPYMVDLPVVENIGSEDNLVDLNEYIKQRLNKKGVKNNEPS